MYQLQVANLARKQQTLRKRLDDAVKETEAATRERKFAAPPEQIEAGQLWALPQSRVRHRRRNSPPRYGVVVDVSRGTGRSISVHVALVSVEIEHAGFGDVVVPQSASPIGCAFMVECWNIRSLPAAILKTPVGPLYGRGIQTIREVLRAVQTGHDLHGALEISGALFRVGPPERLASFRGREGKVSDGLIGLYR